MVVRAEGHGHFAMVSGGGRLHGQFAIAVYKSSYARAFCDVVRGHFAMLLHGHFAIQAYSKNTYSFPIAESLSLWICGQPAKRPAGEVRGQCAKRRTGFAFAPRPHLCPQIHRLNRSRRDRII